MSQTTSETSSAALQLRGVVGFDGNVSQGLILHPNDQQLLYPLGNTVVIKNLQTDKQHFLQGHMESRGLSALALSKSGRLAATGENAHSGFIATVVVWNVATGEILHKLSLHKAAVQAIAFSPDEKYLATVGGRDDNKLAIWDLETGEALCGSHAANDSTYTVQFLNNDPLSLITAGAYNVRLWNIDAQSRKLRPTDAQLGQLKRVVNSISIDSNDQFVYCGTASGDIMVISLPNAILKRTGTTKAFSRGVTSTTLLNSKELLIGAGDGTVALIDIETMKVTQKASFIGSVTSIVVNAAKDHFFAGTTSGSIYCVRLADFAHELRHTAHTAPITDIAFARNYSKLFATAGGSDVRVWNAASLHELLRIQVPNIECLSLTFVPNGSSIITGWSDGKVRAFTPQTGKLAWTIEDAHVGGVTALRCTNAGDRLISGGVNGAVRIWSIEGLVQRLIVSFKEHKTRISSVRVSDDDTAAISASCDGSCIVWSLQRHHRTTCLFAPTQFTTALYHPDGSQFLTCGTDRKLTWWDAVEATPIRILEGSGTHSVSSLDITKDGVYFATGSQDCSVRVYNYDSGLCLNVGYGHSSPITRVAISPDSRLLVSTGSDSAIMVWRFETGENENENVVLQSAPHPLKLEEAKEDIRSSPSSKATSTRKSPSNSKSVSNKLKPRVNPTIRAVNANGTIRK